MATTEYLKEMRGMVISTILTKIGDRRDPEMRDYMLDEAAVGIVVKGWVKTLPEFRKVLNEFMEKVNPTKFGLSELKQVTRRCGVPTGRYAALPFYCHRFPHPAGMTDAEAGRANRRHSEAYRETGDEMRRMVMEFGSQRQREEFDQKEKGVLAPRQAGMPPAFDGCERRVFAPSQWKEYLAFYNAASDDQTIGMSVVRVAADWSRVVDVVPWALVESYEKHCQVFYQANPEPTDGEGAQ